MLSEIMDGLKQALLIGQRMALRILKRKVEEIQISRFSKALLSIHYQRNPNFFKIYVKIIFIVRNKKAPQRAQKNYKHFSSNQIAQSWDYLEVLGASDLKIFTYFRY